MRVIQHKNLDYIRNPNDVLFFRLFEVSTLALCISNQAKIPICKKISRELLPGANFCLLCYFKRLSNPLGVVKVTQGHCWFSSCSRVDDF